MEFELIVTKCQCRLLLLDLVLSSGSFVILLYDLLLYKCLIYLRTYMLLLLLCLRVCAMCLFICVLLPFACHNNTVIQLFEVLQHSFFACCWLFSLKPSTILSRLVLSVMCAYDCLQVLPVLCVCVCVCLSLLLFFILVHFCFIRS